MPETIFASRWQTELLIIYHQHTLQQKTDESENEKQECRLNKLQIKIAIRLNPDEHQIYNSKNIWKKTRFHLIHEKQFCNQFSRRSNNATGKFLFINFMNKAWWLTLSNALLRSIEHKLTVLYTLYSLIPKFSTGKREEFYTISHFASASK